MATVAKPLSDPLTVGTKAPSFDLPSAGADTNVKLSDYAGQNLIIVFYPKDQTPGCTRQLCALQDDKPMFKGINTAILGSNPGSVESHERFREKYGYEFPIVVDAEKTMATAYNAMKDNGGIARTVYIIDGDGVIRFAEQGMPTDETLAEVIKGL